MNRRDKTWEGENNLGANSDSTLNEGSFWQMLVAMRLNLLWYLPLFGFAIFLFSGISLVNAYHDLAVIRRRWTWFISLSLSAYVYFSSVFAEILMPLLLSLWVPMFFSKDAENPTYRRRYLWTLIVLVGIVFTYYVLEVVIWGSFPLDVDKQGYIHLRLIPFYPWPDRPFLK